MYRQVLINPSQRALQRKCYNLNTVTYGTASTSFLAIRSLRQLGIDSEASSPEISTIIKDDIYVDDLLTGSDDLF
ncbi:hypothetical protein HUJ05_001813 [Dendroctonus ponderosae]|nr:hypothetical protein HUJ05_001813 [Dendroctonus ponderosae]